MKPKSSEALKDIMISLILFNIIKEMKELLRDKEVNFGPDKKDKDYNVDEI